MFGMIVRGLTATAVAVALMSPAWSVPVVGSLSPNIQEVPTPGSRFAVGFTPLGVFEQQFNFQSLNGGAFSGTFSWSGFGSVSGFASGLYRTDASYTFPGTKVADYGPSLAPRTLSLDTGDIAPDYYYVLVSGTANGVVTNQNWPVLVSGEFAMKIAEPSVIGLLGLGLAAIGFVGARRRG